MLLLAALKRAEQEHQGVVVAHLAGGERTSVGTVDASGLTEVIDDALRGTVTAVVAVEAPWVKLGVAGQVQLQRAPVEVVEVELVASQRRGARWVVPAGIAAEAEKLLRVGAIHVERCTTSLQEAHSHRLRSVVEGSEDVGLVETFDIHLVAHYSSFLRIFGDDCHSNVS